MKISLPTLVLVVVIEALSFVAFEFTTAEATRGVRRELFAPLEWPGVLIGLEAFIFSVAGAAVVYRRPSLFGIVLGLLLLIFGSITLFLPARAIAWQKPKRDRCAANLRAIVAALHKYRSEHGAYPPLCVADAHGQPMHSWRVLILPYLGRGDLYDQYDFHEAWNSPKNAKLAERRPQVFGCPASWRDSPVTTETNYVAITGTSTAWAKNLGTDSGRDSGSDKAILLAEIADKDWCWMEPRDLDASEAAKKKGDLLSIGITSNHPSDVVVASADGAAWAVPRELSLKTVLPGLIVSDSSKSDWRDRSRYIRASDPLLGTIMTYAVGPLWMLCVVVLLRRARRSGLIRREQTSAE